MITAPMGSVFTAVNALGPCTPPTEKNTVRGNVVTLAAEDASEVPVDSPPLPPNAQMTIQHLEDDLPMAPRAPGGSGSPIRSFGPTMKRKPPSPERADPMKRYLILLSALLMQMCLGAIYSWSVYVHPIKSLTGMLQSTVQLPFSLFYFAFPATMMVTGGLLHRLGPRVCAVIGGILFGEDGSWPALGAIISSSPFWALVLSPGWGWDLPTSFPLQPASAGFRITKALSPALPSLDSEEAPPWSARLGGG